GQSGPSLACPAPSSIPAPTPSPSAQAMYLQKLQESSEAIKAGNFRRAIQLYTESIGLDPENHILYTNRAAAYLKNSQPEKALEDAIRARSICPKWGKRSARQTAAVAKEDLRTQKVQQQSSSKRQIDTVILSGNQEQMYRRKKEFKTNPLLKAGINLASSCWRCGGISLPAAPLVQPSYRCTSRGGGEGATLPRDHDYDE
ncbi:hypothetical protein RRG08_042335, partial [Elysia crispata]